MIIDIDRVTSLIKKTAETLVLPRFSSLDETDVEAKPSPQDPEDIVTIVDREVEAALTSSLQQEILSAPVIGEEAAHHDRSLLDLTSADGPLWIIDPIDGTKNFAAGKPNFGIMVAFVVDGITQAAWIILPALNETYVAERDCGTFFNGNRARVPPLMREVPPRGSILTRYMSEELRHTVAEGLADVVQVVEPSGCAATEYTNVLRGVLDFVVYYRLLPWDHAAPALVLSEGGGCAKHASGGEYTVRSQNQLTIVARDSETSSRLLARAKPVGHRDL